VPPSDPALRRIGKRLRELRQARRLTQDQVAERAGFASGKYVSEVERGVRALPYGTLLRIAESGIGTTLEVVFRGMGRGRTTERDSVPDHVAEIAHRIAELPADKRGRVIAAVREILAVATCD
jgi:transcriptional regulator with XRE-family HTH domain